jgi:hypothetical protein
MAFRYNVLTGELDLVNYPFKSSNSAPTLNQNGEVQVAKIGSDGRIYFRVDNDTFYISGVQIIEAMFIPMGQPIGLMGVTYAEDVT